MGIKKSKVNATFRAIFRSAIAQNVFRSVHTVLWPFENILVDILVEVFIIRSSCFG